MLTPNVCASSRKTGVPASATPTEPTERTQTVASAAVITPNADADERVIVTALGVDAQLANPSPTTLRYDGQVLEVRIKDDGVTRDITYDTQYRACGTALPVATTASKTLYLFFRFNSAATKWDLIGAAQET